MPNVVDYSQRLGRKAMIRLFSVAVLGAFLLLFAPFDARAAAFTPTKPELQSEIQKVHGRHRRCAGDPDYIGSHRHNKWGDWLSCGRRYYYYGTPGVTLHFGNRHRHHRLHRHHRHRRHR
jgi:hypothetical protein